MENENLFPLPCSDWLHTKNFRVSAKMEQVFCEPKKRKTKKRKTSSIFELERRNRKHKTYGSQSEHGKKWSTNFKSRDQAGYPYQGYLRQAKNGPNFSLFTTCSHTTTTHVFPRLFKRVSSTAIVNTSSRADYFDRRASQLSKVVEALVHVDVR